MKTRIDRPGAQLYPYLRNVAADLHNHGFGIVDWRYLADLAVDPSVGYQMELFRQTCRIVSDEKDLNLIIDDQNSDHIIVCLAPDGHDGTIPEIYHDELSEHGVHVQERRGYGVASNEPTIDLHTSYH